MFGKQKRFQEVSCESCAWGTLRVLVDTETGVQYLCGCSAGEGPFPGLAFGQTRRAGRGRRQGKGGGQ